VKVLSSKVAEASTRAITCVLCKLPT